MNRVVLHDAQTKRWLRFSNPVEVIQVHNLSEVQSALSSVETQVEKKGLHAAGFISYEAAPAFDSALTVVPSSGSPLLWFGLYNSPEPIDLPRPTQAREYSLGEWQPSVTRAEYAATIRRIREHIAEGDTYQVNYSFRLRTKFSGDAWSFFLRLAHSQQSLYSAFIETEQFAICSASPELFFRLDRSDLVSRPMKGTARRGLTFADDKRMGEWLQASEKNRSENVMIVDMVRNDIGRVADPSSISVPKLFEVERYPTVWQMTSTVKGKTDQPVGSIMAALFPCASITGAPKVRSTEIIAELESSSRRVYTGAIGHIAPQRKAQFNVAIRTVLIDKPSGEAEYGVGGGIVWDSTADDEYNECVNKARVLTEERPEFSLLETMLWAPDQGYFLLEYHLHRLMQSAEYFGYNCNLTEVRKVLEAASKGFGAASQKIRLLVATDGVTHVEHMATILNRNRPLRLRLAATPVDREDVFLYHKTTHRVIYDRVRAGCSDCDDVVLWNAQGEVTESTVANIVAETENGLITPPVECGLLAGTFRQLLLEQGKIQEQKITVEEWRKAKVIYLVNSVRQWQEARLL